MSIEYKGLIGLGILAALILLAVLFRNLPKRLKTKYFQAGWLELQAFCKDKATWPMALTEADHLLDRALKKRKFRGKSMGERMVSAQRIFTENDSVWYAHNLIKKINANAGIKLREKDVKVALMGFRQALRDLGALPSGDSKDAG